MPELADIQAGIRDAMVRGDADGVAPFLLGGLNPARRLAVHQRHYEASLTKALIDRFPATVWLVGPGLVSDAAHGFIREHPPSRPCMAEYGEAFPASLGAHPGAASLPYLAQFAELEWHLGRLALATDDSPHVHYLHLDWILDELIGLYLTDSAPDRFVLAPCDAWLEIRGLRGELQMRRMTEEDVAHAQ